MRKFKVLWEENQENFISAIVGIIGLIAIIVIQIIEVGQKRICLMQLKI